jgi:hypothetical protein
MIDKREELAQLAQNTQDCLCDFDFGGTRQQVLDLESLIKKASWLDHELRRDFLAHMKELLSLWKIGEKLVDDAFFITEDILDRLEEDVD